VESDVIQVPNEVDVPIPVWVILIRFTISITVNNQNITDHDNRLTVGTLTDSSNVNHDVDTVCHCWINGPTHVWHLEVVTPSGVMAATHAGAVRSGKAAVVLHSKVGLWPATSILPGKNVRCKHRTVGIGALASPVHQTVLPEVECPSSRNPPCRYLVAL
jgi:hypothetical protein